MKRFSGLAASAFALTVGFTGTAGALTVTKLADAPTAWATAMAATPDTLSKPGTWSVTPSTRIGNKPGDWRSPFDNESLPGLPNNSAYIGKSYWAVGPDNPTNPARMTFATDQNSLSFLWGSVDTYNTLEFYLNSVLQGKVTDFSFAGNQSGRGASYVKITGVVFDEIRFGSTQLDAFEFSNLSTTPVPIPAAAWLLGSGLLGLFGLARRKQVAAA
jgi:hypothetical protein